MDKLILAYWPIILFAGGVVAMFARILYRQNQQERDNEKREAENKELRVIVNKTVETQIIHGQLLGNYHRRLGPVEEAVWRIPVIENNVGWIVRTLGGTPQTKLESPPATVIVQPRKEK